MTNKNIFRDLELDDKQSGGFVQIAATVIAVSISALASYQFFALFSGALLSGLLPQELLSVAAGLVGVIMLEGAALYWQNSLQQDADSQRQLSIARTGYLVSVAVSVIVTMLYFLLTSSLIEMAEIEPLVRAFAALVLIGIIGFQFVAKLAYSMAATVSSQAQHNTKIRAYHNKANFLLQQESTEAHLSSSVAAVREKIPETAAAAAERAQSDFLADQARQAERPGQSLAASINGQRAEQM